MIVNWGFWPFAAHLPVRKEEAESDRRWWTAVLLMLASNQLDLLPDSADLSMSEGKRQIIHHSEVGRDA